MMGLKIYKVNCVGTVHILYNWVGLALNKHIAAWPTFEQSLVKTQTIGVESRKCLEVLLVVVGWRWCLIYMAKSWADRVGWGQSLGDWYMLIVSFAFSFIYVV